MSNLSDAAQDILDVMWFDHFETAADKRSLAADILRALAKQSTFADVAVNRTEEVVLVDDILKIVEELEQF